jgi:hypothetical protein
MMSSSRIAPSSRTPPQGGPVEAVTGKNGAIGTHPAKRGGRHGSRAARLLARDGGRPHSTFKSPTGGDVQ